MNLLSDSMTVIVTGGLWPRACALLTWWGLWQCLGWSHFRVWENLHHFHCSKRCMFGRVWCEIQMLAVLAERATGGGREDWPLLVNPFISWGLELWLFSCICTPLQWPRPGLWVHPSHLHLGSSHLEAHLQAESGVVLADTTCWWHLSGCPECLQAYITPAHIIRNVFPEQICGNVILHYYITIIMVTPNWATPSFQLAVRVAFQDDVHIILIVLLQLEAHT